jgi:hypothetical protein
MARHGEIMSYPSGPEKTNTMSSGENVRKAFRRSAACAIEPSVGSSSASRIGSKCWAMWSASSPSADSRGRANVRPALRGQSPSIKKLGHANLPALQVSSGSGSFSKIEGMLKNGDTKRDARSRKTKPFGTIGPGSCKKVRII